MSDNSGNLPFEKIKSGLAVAFALIAIAAFLYFLPNTLGSPSVSKIVAIIIAMFGIAVLHGELIMLNHGSRSYKTENIGVGMFFAGIWALLYNAMPVWYVNIFSFSILAFGLYGIGRGIIDSIGLLTKPASGSMQMVKIIALIILIAALIFTGWKLVEIVTAAPASVAPAGMKNI